MPDILSEASHDFPALIQVNSDVKLEQMYNSGKAFDRLSGVPVSVSAAAICNLFEVFHSTAGRMDTLSVPVYMAFRNAHNSQIWRICC
jgi:hypothetical protein